MDMNHDLIALANVRMPFGKHRDQLIHRLPERYLIWLRSQDIVKGKLAVQIDQIAEIKLNGLERLLTPLVKG
ncbi:putative quorum-sensing-regulated virulence factor [Psychrobium sp. 1_MG-2023]|uniref:putative quorum-sensing-regulated virulence factor n=1 Tax=Psychrobium sp. 1_MG-2023 TaxID=3062624 RepID=UPI000C33A486|nr:DUF3820 family protein [Psychrobium sp. 1_MG-2023]MDP2562473.1 DUF3820 family protein [Psychrobium sp. 1_MG-2023]PKF54307.1 hypothetical protein CW748_16385 [Alteromonadales bacterium alter-6D02]